MQGQVRAECQQEKGEPSWMQFFLDTKSLWDFRDDLESACAVRMHGVAGANVPS